MASPETLNALREIVDTLLPLRSKERGEPLRSEEWNRVIDAIVSLARLGDQQERRTDDQLASGFAPAGHDHLGAVDLAWFEPRTRDLLNQATAAAETAGTIRGLEAKLERTARLVEDQRVELERLRDLVDGQRSRELARDRQLVAVTERFESVRTVVDDVTDLRVRFGGLGAQLTQTLELTRAVDLPALNALGGRVRDLEQLRERFVASDGSLGRYRDLELRLAELAQGGVTDATLDRVVGERLRGEALWRDEQVAARVAGLVDARTEPRFGALAWSVDGLTAELATRRVAEQALQVAVTDHGAKLDGLQSETVQLGGRIGMLDDKTAALAAQASRVTAVEGRLGLLEGRSAAIDALAGRVSASEVQTADLRAAFDRQSVDAEARLSAVERERVAIADLGLRSDALAGSVRDLSGSVSSLGARALEADARLDDLGVRWAPVEREVGALGTWRSSAEGPLSRLLAGPSPQAIADRTSMLEAEVRIAKGVLDAQRVRTDGLEVRSAEQADQVSRLEARVPVLERGQADLGAQLESVAARASVDPVWQRDVEDRLGRAEAGVSQLADLERRTADLGVAVQALSPLGGRLDALASEVAGARAQLDATGRRLDPLEAQVAGFSNVIPRLSAVEDRTLRLDGEVRRVAGQQDAVTSAVTAAGTRLDQVDARLGTTEVRVQAVDTRLGAAENRVRGVDTRLGTVEGRMLPLNPRFRPQGPG